MLLIQTENKRRLSAIAMQISVEWTTTEGVATPDWRWQSQERERELQSSQKKQRRNKKQQYETFLASRTKHNRAEVNPPQSGAGGNNGSKQYWQHRQYARGDTYKYPVDRQTMYAVVYACCWCGHAWLIKRITFYAALSGILAASPTIGTFSKFSISAYRVLHCLSVYTWDAFK